MNELRSAIGTYLHENRDRHIAKIQEFLRQPSVASANIGVAEGAELLARYYRELGCQEVELIQTAGHPGLFAFYDAGAEKTLVVYGMWDTKPASESEWGGDPFAAEVVNMEGYGEVVRAPGAKGRKAPYIAFLNALEALKSTQGELPVNILFLGEGEENNGSPNYRAFVDKYRDRISEADACIAPGAIQDKNGDVEIHLGFKGLLCIKLTASGLRSGVGPQKVPSHAMAQVIVDSPVWRLLSALETLTTNDGRAITVDHFHDERQEVSHAEREEIREMIKEYEGRHWSEVLPGIRDAKSSNDNLSMEDAFVHYFYEPNCNINGLAAGYTGPGTKVFTLPNEAYAMLDIRLPRGYSTLRSAERIKQHLSARGYDDIDVEITAQHEPMRTASDDEFVQIALQVLADRGVSASLWPTSGGGGPWSLFDAEFGMPVIFDLGLGYGNNAGMPGEFLALDQNGKLAGLEQAEEFYCDLLTRWSSN
ncbi:MAG: M20/M25/M40 family metallo-hydrolase [Thermomicrobiales bacterium]|nr:M20/M25/M40 family metallo-hydrolase [Thermomicrobiales bacterium]MCO5227701.1 M20/M25/M40 family metallo-hydrolase [Thermomicrobiales bacterium]